MAAKTNTSNAFTFLWNVKDFRMLEACTSLDSDTIRSPAFRMNPESETEWCLVLSHSNSEEMDVRIEYSHTPSDAELHLKSELFVVSRLGEEKLLSQQDCWMEMGSQSIGSLDPADILNNHLQNDTLTLKVKLEVGPSRDYDDFDIDSPAENDADNDTPAEELPVPNACTASSRLEKYRKRVIWTVDTTELSPQHPEVSLRVTSPYKHLPAFQIFFAAPDQEDHANLMIMLDEAVFVQCTASVMQAQHEYRVTEPMSYVRADSVCSFAPFVHLGRLKEEQYFKNTKGVLYLLFDFLFSSVKQMQHVVVKCSGPDISLPKPPQKLAALEDFGRLYQTGESADAEIRCSGRTFPVHRLILGARSAVFEAMFRTDMSEAKARSAEIADVDPDTLHRLISFLYSNSVERLGFLEATSLYTAADKYQVLPLRCHCSVVLMTLIAADNVCEALRFADLQRDRDLLDCGVEFVRDNQVQVLASQDWMDLMKENATLAASIMHKLLMDA